jgi:hypothetical protein
MEPTVEPRDLNWPEAEENFRFYMAQYVEIGPTGRFALVAVFWPLESRFDKGERTQDLYDAMMNVK